MPRRKGSSHTWIYVVWGLNGFALLSLLAFSALYRTSLRVSAADDAIPSARPGETREIPPTSYFLPTLTPNPLYTPPVFETPTPFKLVNGPRPSVIGFSLAGRPIDVYTFGRGEKNI